MKARLVAAGLATAFIASPAFAAPVDLTPWLQDGGGNWVLETGNNGVKQTQNSAPGVYHNNENSQGKSLSGTIQVQTGSDDDFIGFVLGYIDGDIGGGDVGQDYLMIDWKQGTQSGWNAGLSISRVTGDISTCGTCTGSAAWQHNGVVDFLTRSNGTDSVYGNTGWADNTEYTFDLEFTSTKVKVFVDAILEIEINAADYGLSGFADGSFGFYGFSQENVRYAGITEEVLPPTIPLPAALPLLGGGIGLMGFMSYRRKRATA